MKGDFLYREHPQGLPVVCSFIILFTISSTSGEIGECLIRAV